MSALVEVRLDATLVEALRAKARQERVSLSAVITAAVVEAGLGGIAFDAAAAPRVVRIGPEHLPDAETLAVRAQIAYLLWCLTDAACRARYDGLAERQERFFARNAKISEKLRGRVQSEATRAKIAAKKLGLRQTAEHRAAISAGLRRHYQSAA